MRKISISLVAAMMALAAPALAGAQTAASAAATSQSATASATAAAKYTTEETPIGTLLDDPEAKAIVEKHIPGFTTNDQVDMARAMTLKQVQQYAPDDVTDEKLAAIDADFAKLK